MKRVVILAFYTCSFLLPFMASAQPGDPNGGTKPVPITGIEILLATGSLLGVKKMMNSRKNKS